VGDLSTLARFLVAAGLCLAAVGGLILLAGRVPGLDWLGRLPGDFTVRKGPVTIFAPIATSILLSLLLTLILNVIARR